LATISWIHNQDFWFNSSFVEKLSRNYLSSLEKHVLLLPKVSLFLQFVLLFKIEKNIKNIYCTWEPPLFVKDDNCIDKDYEKVNEQNIVMRRWGCIFCWLGRMVSHDGSKRPSYPAVVEQKEVEINIERGKLEIQTDIKIHLMEWLVVTTDAEPLWGHVWTLLKMMFFGTKRLLHPILEPWRLKIFNFKGQWKIWRSL
jgi:hypothetical protein